MVSGRQTESCVCAKRQRQTHVWTWGEGIPQGPTYLPMQTQNPELALVPDLDLGEGWETGGKERALLIFITLWTF